MSQPDPMSQPNPVKELLRRRGEGGAPLGLLSACTASELAIEAFVDRAAGRGGLLLVEATANQVDQRGGYTGMKPADFARFVHAIAGRRDLPAARIALGGDHLGPLTWRKLPAAEAMVEARELVRLFVLAGFSKIHLDTSMKLGDDHPEERLATEVMAERAAVLARVAEDAHAELLRARPEGAELAYVVGSEVPVPGGTTEQEELQITSPADLAETVGTFRRVFERQGLATAWERVVAVVVQPGVEFGDASVHGYDRAAAAPLTAELRRHAPLVLEGHSTDYQTARALRELVEDGVGLLKVGPGLTFAEREGLLALECIERELLHGREGERSRFSEALEAEMLRDPSRWAAHYHGDAAARRLARRFSYSDRSRYYTGAAPVRQAVARLFENLDRETIPATLLSQFLPAQYAALREGRLGQRTTARELVKDHIGECVDVYAQATAPLRPPAPPGAPA